MLSDSMSWRHVLIQHVKEDVKKNFSWDIGSHGIDVTYSSLEMYFCQENYKERSLGLTLYMLNFSEGT